MATKKRAAKKEVIKKRAKKKSAKGKSNSKIEASKPIPKKRSSNPKIEKSKATRKKPSKTPKKSAGTKPKTAKKKAASKTRGIPPKLKTSVSLIKRKPSALQKKIYEAEEKDKKRRRREFIELLGLGVTDDEAVAAYEFALRNDLVPYYDDEKLHTGRKGNQKYPLGSIALQPSRLRILPAYFQDKYMKMLSSAAKISEDELDRVAHEIAEETGMDVREVYSYWFSP